MVAGFRQVSFVNSIATVKGGTHVEYITNQVVKHIMATINNPMAMADAIGGTIDRAAVFGGAILDDPDDPYYKFQVGSGEAEAAPLCKESESAKRAKAQAGGYVKDVHFANIVLGNVSRAALSIDSGYGAANPACGPLRAPACAAYV